MDTIGNLMIKQKPPVGVKEICLLGFRFHPMTRDDVIEAIRANVKAGTRMIMGNLNLHGMAVMYNSVGMNRLNSAPEALVMIDGMPIIWLARLLGKNVDRSQRMTSLDYFDDMFRLGVREGWRFDYVGSTPQVLQDGIEVLRQRMPGLDIEGYDGYFDIKDASAGSRQREILDWLNKRNSDVLIVGMGMPRQEEWLDSIQGKTPARVLIPVGAYLEYQVGSLALPPRWMGQLGVEWAYRLLTSPRRLAYRYLVEPFYLLFLLMFRKHPQKAYWEMKLRL